MHVRIPTQSIKCGRRTRGQYPCKNWALPGQTVCRMHGGKAPAALAKAEERLRDLEHPAISRLAHLIDHADNDAVKLAAARWLLELLGHKPAIQAQVEQNVTIRIVDEAQPIVLEHAYLNGRADG